LNIKSPIFSRFCDLPFFPSHAQGIFTASDSSRAKQKPPTLKRLALINACLDALPHAKTTVIMPPASPRNSPTSKECPSHQCAIRHRPIVAWQGCLDARRQIAFVLVVILITPEGTTETVANAVITACSKI
jgi:hypothetical protein